MDIQFVKVVVRTDTSNIVQPKPNAIWNFYESSLSTQSPSFLASHSIEFISRIAIAMAIESRITGLSILNDWR